MSDAGSRTDVLNSVDAVPDDEWRIYAQGIEAVQRAGVPFAIGGGVAYGVYANRTRNTKDLDLFLRPADRERAIAAIRDAQFDDYFDQNSYERHWIFRGFRDGLILDLIWQMANRRAEVDDAWVTRGPMLTLHGMQVRVLPAEEMIWGKLYVLQRERCDWTDIVNIFSGVGASLDWDHLVARVGDDLPLLSSVLQVYGWLVPQEARAIPARVWERLGLARPSGDVSAVDRVALLDSRDWFGPPDRAE